MSRSTRHFASIADQAALALLEVAHDLVSVAGPAVVPARRARHQREEEDHGLIGFDRATWSRREAQRGTSRSVDRTASAETTVLTMPGP
jgi:hypothetical protein